MRPTETMTTASVGYHSTGTGLEIALAAISSDLADAARRRRRLPASRRGGELLWSGGQRTESKEKA